MFPMPWLEPSLTLRWGEYRKLDAQDELQRVQTVAAAKTAGVITKRQAVEKLAPVFGTKDVTAVVEALGEEADEEIAAAQKAMGGGATTKPTKPDAGGGAERPSADPSRAT